MTECLLCRNECRIISDNKGRSYHICRSCGFISLDRAFALSEKEEEERYRLHNNDAGDQGYVRWLKSFIDRAVVPFAEKNARILDFGSGPEPVLAGLLGEMGFEVCVYDKYFSPFMPEGTFDVITSTEVFEHLADPYETLLLLKDRLRSRGFLALKTSFIPETDEEFLSWWYREDSTHISFFSPQSFSFLAGASHLTLEYCDEKSIVILRN
ncbi:MAG: class I SAM-dependent methyltransferase [Spirochaetales bacterium]|nr:class I SAM-dependent methyltransferase [Spirochaetales bacterium]